MVTVSGDPVEVEAQLVSGGLSCPSCGGRLGPWGHARARSVREEGDGQVEVMPRRSRCRDCKATHVLLPWSLLLRRADVVAVIGRALELFAVGTACRAIARRLGRARSTVRGWRARLAVRAELLRAHFTRWAVWLGGRLPAPADGPVADAVAAIIAAGQAAADRLGADRWPFAASATGGRLLCNTASPFPAPWRP